MKRKESFGSLVRDLRRSLDLTQDELARRVGCAAVTLRKIEAEDLRPSQQIAERLAISLGIPLEERAAFVRLARAIHPEHGVPASISPTPSPEEIGAEDLSGRAIRGYALGERIGAGGFGVVYRAIQPVVEREVAVKIILPHYANQPEFIRRFEAEAQLVARLEHPHIVPLYDYWREPGAAYLVMRLLRGGSMHTLLQESGPLPLNRVVLTMEQVGAALSAAHRAGVIHRDLKPANILLDEYENAYLADFGIAKNLGDPCLEERTRADEIVGSPAYFSPEQIRSETVRPQADIYSLGVVFYELLTGVKPFQGKTPMDFIQQHLSAPLPPLAAARTGLPAGLDAVIARATAKEASQRYSDVEEMIEHIHRVLAGGADAVIGKPIPSATLPEPENPYKGLRSFGETDAQDFFGRETLVQQLLARLGEGGDLARFLAVVGPSGSGKSSAVKAGLIPALRRGGLPGSENWFIVDLIPGAHPFEELEAALLRIAVRPPDSLLGQLTEHKRGLLRAVQRCLPEDPEVELVLVIDQFEEIFTLVEDEAVRSLLLDSLVAATLDERSRVRIVITLRADFIDRPLNYVDFGELLRQRMEVVLPLTPDELALAVSKPAERVGVNLESGLEAVILQDVSNQPGALPLLQYSLTELFTRREGRLLTRHAYDEIGGVVGALGRRAEEAYSELDEAAQQAARQLCLRLITLGEGAEDTRRRVLRTEVESLQIGANLAAVIDTFGKSRLFTFDRDPLTRGPTLEVAHEALLREWPRLRDWIDANRADVRLQRQLAAAAADWQAAGMEASFLLNGARLAQFEGWAATNAVTLTQAEREFLDASITQRHLLQAEESARQQRELEAAQKLARTERSAAQRMRTRNRIISVVGAIALLLAVLAGLLGLQASQNARQAEEQRSIAVTAQAQAVSQRSAALSAQDAAEASARVATARELAAAAIFNLDVDPERSVLLALQAVATTRSVDQIVLPEAAAALHQALLANRLEYRITGTPNSGWTWTAYTQNGKYLATAIGDTNVTFWEAATGKKAFTLGEPPEPVYLAEIGEIPDNVTTFSISPDDTHLAAGSIGGFGRVWDLTTGKLLWELQERISSVTNYAMIGGIAYSRDGKLIATASHNGKAQIWDAQNGRLLQTLEGHKDIIWVASFNADGSRLATASFDQTARLWDLTSGKELFVLDHAGIVDSVDFNPDGKSFATSDVNGMVRIWDAATGELLHAIQAHDVEVMSVRYSMDGKYLSTCAYDASVKVFDTVTGKELITLKGHSAATFSAAFSPDARYLATGSDDGTGKVWNISSTGRREWLTVDVGPAPQMSKAAYSPDGKFIAAGGADGKAYIWDALTGQVLHTLSHPAGVISVSFSPDGALLAVSGEKGSISLWEIITEKRLPNPTVNHDLNIREISFSPDGKTLATSGDDKTTTFWDADTGDQLWAHKPGTLLQFFSFSPDGQWIAIDPGTGTVHLYNVESKAQIIEIKPSDSAWSMDLAFSPDSTRLAMACNDGTARIFEVASGEELFILANHIGGVSSVTYSLDGNLVATGGMDGAIWIWNAITGEDVFSIPSNAGGVNSLAFNPDGTRLLASHADGTVKVYAVKIEDLVALAEARLTRSLTEEECQKYLHKNTCPDY